MDEKRYALKDALQGNDIKLIRHRLGLTQKEFAEFINVSAKTIERWEVGDKDITGPIVTLVKVLNQDPTIETKLSIPRKEYPLRLYYYYKNDLCTVIDVDERNRKVQIYNYVEHFMLKAFGNAKNVTYEDYEEFLESRCFPRTRDKMKLVLRDLDLPFYDPMMIIEKTDGRMTEDHFWIKIER